MESPLILDKTKQIDVWFYSKTLPVKKKEYTEWLDATHCVFLECFGEYFKIETKILYEDEIDHNVLNFVILPCLEFSNIIKSYNSIDDELYQFCLKNNFKIVIAQTREVLPTNRDVYKLIESTIAETARSSNVVKILVNGVDRYHLSIVNITFFSYFWNVNYFDHLLRVYINRKKIKSDYGFLENRSYDFSLLTGMLKGRPVRSVFLYECAKRNLIDERFFYSIICENKKNILEDFIYYEGDNKVLGNNKPEDIKFFLNDFVENKIYYEDGERIEDKDCYDIYETREEFKIPKQVIDSYIHVVLETEYDLDIKYFTEKTYKPLLAGLPFIWYGPKNSVQLLEKQGYKMYPFIDYSFDKETIQHLKIKKLVDEIERLKTLNLKELVIKHRDISEHNRKMFYENTNKYDDFWSTISNHHKTHNFLKKNKNKIGWKNLLRIKAKYQQNNFY